MIIRELEKNDLLQANIISSVAFEFPFDVEKFDSNEKQNELLSQKVDDFTPISIGAFDDDNTTLYSSFTSYPYKVRFDGNEVMMGGVGGVSTLPPYRRSGCVRESFKYLFPKLKKENYLLSFLYPFSCSYYRQFGYEVSSLVNTWSIDLKALKKSGIEGKVEFLTPDSSSEIIDKIYNEMYNNYNLSVLRKDYNYKYFNKRDTYKNKNYAYVWKNKDGEAKGFIMFKKALVNGKNVMDCTHFFGETHDLIFADREAFLGLMDFVLTFSSNYDSIKFLLPSNIRLEGLINESNFTSCKTSSRGMVRVIDVEGILKLCKFKGTGELKINISDKYCDWNNGIFHVSFKNGVCENICKASEDFDISMDISTFSSLICGNYHSVHDCLKQDLEISNNSDDIEKVFYFKPNMVVDLF